MNYFSAQDIKRRGISAVDRVLEDGPAYVFKNNKPKYVVMSSEDYQQLLEDLAEARLAASEADLDAGRVRRGSARELIAEVREEAPEDRG
jgi:PHD/YefM family antitoxin component YafN of YafNO toxin-antitoxin module